MILQELIKRNYQTTVNRGKINIFTSSEEFIAKIDEEVQELKDSFLPFDQLTNPAFDHKELADIILVCLNFAHHFDIDIEKVLEEKLIINENRKD